MSKCENCQKYADCASGSGLTWPCGAYVPKAQAPEKIHTYPEMNETIKDLLRRSEEPMNQYILARIEELEAQVKSISGTERQNRNKLFELMAENPDLPVIPFVDTEICGDDYGTYMGSWGCARLDEYIIPTNNDYVRFKSDDDVFDVLERCLSTEEFDALPESESKCRKIYDALPWIKAIIVDINTPE